MDIAELRAALKKAAAVFRGAGARAQAQSIEAVDSLIRKSGDATLEEFVERTKEALQVKPLAELSAAEVIELLADAGTDAAKFNLIFLQLEARSFSKDKALEIAARFTGGRKSSWSSKSKALQAIKSKFDDRVFQASKDSANSGVTPW